MDEHRINFLSDKIVTGTITDAEMKEFNDWYVAFDGLEQEVSSDFEREVLSARLYNQITEQSKDLETRVKKNRFALWQRISAAAAILIMTGTGILFYERTHKASTGQNKPYASDISPGVNQATLILANGKKIILNNTVNGQLPKQHGVIINKARNGEIIYTALAASGAPVQYNTLVTARGEQYQIILPDGSHVWLNAASSIKYPVAFNSNERKVELSGEAYFEVVHNGNKPFRVVVKGQTVEDIGTHFDIDAYDEAAAMTTTVLEGSVKVTKGASSVILQPGQAALNTTHIDDITIKDADTGVVAWKDGYFYFNHANVQTVMQEFARWYDVNVVYQGAMPKVIFKGKIYRNENASQALKILSYFGVHFKIEGRIIYVSA